MSSRLSIDLETFSSVDLKKAGAYAYTASPDFEIILFGYAWDDEPVRVLDLAQGDRIPWDVEDAILSGAVNIHAYNANFERLCLSRHFKVDGFLSPDNYRCTAVHGLYLGLPGHLKDLSAVLFPNSKDQQKFDGYNLIRYFGCPCKPTKTNGGRTRNRPEHDKAKWEKFKTYCGQDVEVERAAYKILSKFPVPEKELKLYALDQRINDRGILIDTDMVNHAIECDRLNKEATMTEAVKLTGLDNPNSVSQLKDWLFDETMEVVESLNKEKVKDLLKASEDSTVRQVLHLRQEMSKTSVKKYHAMARALCPDGRVRGLVQFYGANRTGRWCLTGDHEVLTREGWARLDSWCGGLIACWNSQTEAISFQKAGAVSFPYEGDVYCIESQRCSQISTPDHKMPYWDNTEGWKAKTVEELANKKGRRFAIPFTGRRSTPGYIDHIPVRVLVMVQADGHFTADGSLRFHFSKPRKIERCKTLLRRAEIPFIVTDRGKSSVILIKQRHLPLWLQMFQDKNFGPWLLDLSADIFFDELEHWDAYRCGPNSLQYTTINKNNADLVQALAHLSGRSAVMLVKDRSIQNENWNTAYAVNIWLNPGTLTRIDERPKKEYFEGQVYCAETETGFFVVRRNGKVWITGNSGRLIQVQNLAKNFLPDLDSLRGVLCRGYYELITYLYTSPQDCLSQLVRTAFVAPSDKTFLVADFSAIEARVIAWLARERWRLDVFETHGKIYEASASQMFHVPWSEFEEYMKQGKKHPLRAKGKVAELALGFSGSSGALIAMGALKDGLTEEELPDIVARWRQASPSIVNFWATVQEAAHKAVRDKAYVEVDHGVSYHYDKGFLFATLPSGRRLAYVKPRFQTGKKFGNQVLAYEGMNQETKRWVTIETFGGKLVENLVQAIARDCLAEALLRLDETGFQTVMHVHDEAVMEGQEDQLELACEIMGRPIEWAKGLPLRADGYCTPFYKKDD